MNSKLHIVRKSTFALSAAALALAGCAGAPEKPPLALEQARSTYQSALTNQQVSRLAPNELSRAGKALTDAERLWLAGDDTAEVEHRAYLAQQQARIAAEAARTRAAQAQIQQAGVQRERVVAQARQAEAQAQSRAAEQQRAQALQQAQQARQQAQQEQQRAAHAQQQVGQLQAELEKLQAQQTDRGWVLSVSGDVLFDVGQATLTPGAYHSLSQLAGFLRAHPQESVVVEGYTDDTGSEQFNLDLSQRRAQAVKQALIAQNVAAQRIVTRAFGESFPIASNGTASGRQLNRRVEFVLSRTDTEVAGLSR